jgi:tetratricopeptide (TPR) repeat protein
VVLEDLHWGDFPTVKFFDRALRDGKTLPFFILALARPEVYDVFPRLWVEREVQEIRLKQLGAKAAERLARHVLGEHARADLVSKLVKLADGNAFYLEELIRAAASGKADDLPETVVAMVQSRLSELEERARRILRAASIFGEVFWMGGVAGLLGTTENDSMLRELLAELTERELLVRREESRFPGQDEYAFRHALLREGAYAMLTTDDRTLGHRLAGEWLEMRGERDPVVLAEHFEVGGDGARAGKYYLTAAEHAHLGGDTVTSLAHTRKGLACTTSSELRIELLGLFCELHYYQRNEITNALPYAEELIRDAPMGSEPWIQGMFIKMLGGAQLGKPEEFGGALFSLGQIDVKKGTEGALAFAYTVAAYVLDVSGQPQMADSIMGRLEGLAKGAVAYDPRAMGMWYIMSAAREAYAHQDPWKARVYAESAANFGLKAKHLRMHDVGKSFLGMQTWFLGLRDEAEALLQGIKLSHEEMGFAATPRPICLAWVLAERGAFAEARGWADVLIQYGVTRHLTSDEGEGRWALAEILRRAGDLEGADREIEASIKLLRPKNVLDAPALLATLARIRLAQGRVEEAVAAATEGVMIYEKTGACAYFRAVYLRLAQVESLEAAGQHDKACAALEKARKEVLANADKISDPEYRRHYLEDAVEPRRILELSREWLPSGA